MTKEQKEKLTDALYKRAVGYTATEENEEYSMIDGRLELVKRKVGYREVPPELSAIKTLLDEEKEDGTELTEEQLVKERDRLLEILFSKYGGKKKNRKPD